MSPQDTPELHPVPQSTSPSALSGLGLPWGAVPVPGHTVGEEPFCNSSLKLSDTAPAVFPLAGFSHHCFPSVQLPPPAELLRAGPASPQTLRADPAIASPQGGSRLPSEPLLRAGPASPQGGSGLPSEPPLRAGSAMFRGQRAWFSQSVSPGLRGLWGEWARTTAKSRGAPGHRAGRNPRGNWEEHSLVTTQGELEGEHSPVVPQQDTAVGAVTPS